MTTTSPATLALNVEPITDVAPGHRVTVLIEQAQKLIQIARALAATNRPVDLDGLADLVGLLCAQTLDLQPEQGRMLRAPMTALLAECDALNNTLRHPTRPRQKAASCPSHPRCS